MTRHEDTNDRAQVAGIPLPPGELRLTTYAGHDLSLKGWYKGKSIFFLGNAPSLATDYDLSLLGQRGIVTWGVNNGWAVYKPTIWTCLDSPGSFLDTGWKDPSILKFVPVALRHHRLRVKVKEPAEFKPSCFRVSDMPAVFYFVRNQTFNHNTFLTEDTVNWGHGPESKDSVGHGGCRSVMLSSLRLIHYLGFSRMYLIGTSFRMQEGKPGYAFEQARTRKLVRGNTAAYRILNDRFAALRPLLESSGLTVHNCTPNSALTAFDYLPYTEAVRRAARECGKIVSTTGWYDHQDAIKNVCPRPPSSPAPEAAPPPSPS